MLPAALASAVCWTGGCARDSAEVRPLVPYARASSMTLRIDCHPGQAEVRIDGVFQGSCELLGRPGKVMRLEAGDHELEVSAEGYRSFRSPISARGMRQNLTVHLQARPVP